MKKTTISILNVLNEIYKNHKLEPVHYLKIEEYCKFYKCINSVTTGMVRSGVAQRLSKGVYKLNIEPTKETAQLISDCLKAMQLENYKKRALYKRHQYEESIKKTVQIGMPLVEKYTTEQAIKHLKSLGYKIMKPIQPQYEEI